MLWALSFEARFPYGRPLVMAVPLLLGLLALALLTKLSARLRVLRGRVQQLRRSLDAAAREQALDQLQVGGERSAPVAGEVPVRPSRRDRPRSALLCRLSSLLDLALQLLTFMRISLLMAAVILSLGRAAQHTHARAWAVR